MPALLRAHLKALALAGLLLSLAGPVMAQAVTGDEVVSVDIPSEPDDSSFSEPDDSAVIDDTTFPDDSALLDDTTIPDDSVVIDDTEIVDPIIVVDEREMLGSDDGGFNPEIYYTMGREGCIVCRGGDAGAEDAASEAASSAADRAVDQIISTDSDPAL